MNQTILALDLGTHTGYAARRPDGQIIHGTTSFAPRASWSAGQRALRFQSWLDEQIAQQQVRVIAYEQVIRHVGTEAAHLYGLFEGLVWMAADRNCVKVRTVGVGEIKKHWTGWGDTSKDGMIAEARRRGFRPDSDNAADALAILNWALTTGPARGAGLGDGSLPDPATVLRRPRTPKPPRSTTQRTFL